MPKMPKVWNEDQLRHDAELSVERFKESRITESEQLASSTHSSVSTMRRWRRQRIGIVPSARTELFAQDF